MTGRGDLRPRATFALQPIAPDVFLARPGAPGVAHRDVFRIERDATGHVVAALVTMERLKGIRLPRRSAASKPR